jgi:cob(I)alamin adenosyltransferase
MEKLSRGYVQVYTGNGKGKTTAAVGQGVRAAGNKYTVYMIQFLKGGETGELESIKSLHPYFQIFRFEKRRGFFWNLNDDEKRELKEEIQEGYKFALDVLKENKCDLLILDEIMGAISNKLITEEQVLSLIDAKPEDIELIMTGRNVPESLIERANLVTEMRDIKHYFSEGVPARKGIEY